MGVFQRATPNPYLIKQDITDIYVRKNFENLDTYFQTQNQLLDFQFFDQTFTAAQTGVKLAHGLDFIPCDIIVTQITGTGSVTFQRGQFTNQYVIFDVSGPCRIRFFVGTHWRTPPGQSASTSDVSVFSAQNATSASTTKKAPTVQIFTAGAGTYQTPSGVLYLRIRMVGGGGGGGANAGSGGAGGSTTFGTAFLTAAGGSGGASGGGTGNGGAGGAATINAGATGTGLTGATGGNGAGSAVNGNGGNGGNTPFGGGGGIGRIGGTGIAAITNTGGGGGGAGADTGSANPGGGGGAGAFVDVVIAAPAASYAYAVGVAGTAGTGGSLNGGAGGSGYIEVTEYYQ